MVRVQGDGGATLALLANAYESAFSTCWPAGSRCVLDAFLEGFQEATGETSTRLHAAFAIARARFLEAAPTLTSFDPDEPPGAALLAAALEGSTAHVVWIGRAVGMLLRGGEVVAETSPDTLHERVRREHPEWTDLSSLPDVQVRTLCAADEAPPSHVALEVASGDTLILMSRAAYRAPAKLEELAEHLADLGFGDPAVHYVAVAVLRFVGDDSRVVHPSP